MTCVPVLGQCVVDQLVLVALPGHVSAKAKECCDIDSVNVLGVLNVAAQIKLSKDTLTDLLLKHNTHHRDVHTRTRPCFLTENVGSC